MDESLAITCQPPAIGIDLTAFFVTDQGFRERDDMVEWARRVGRDQRFTVSIGRSDNGTDKRKPFILLCCSDKKKYACPFRLRGYYHASKEWHLSVVCGIHNHRLDREVQSSGRLKPRDREFIDDLIINQVPHEEMITKLKERGLTIKQVYNARHRLKKASKEGQSSFCKDNVDDEEVEIEKDNVDDEEVEIEREASPVYDIQYVEHMPKFMKKFIDNIIDVRGDGFCGYRVVALHMVGDENEFDQVKLNMLKELEANKKLYVALYGGRKRYDLMKKALHKPRRSVRHGVAPLEFWFSFPDMGHLVATYYNIVLVQLTNPCIGVSETFFPLRGAPPIDPSSEMMCIGLVPNHFVYVHLKEGCPLPPTSIDWAHHRSDESAAWEYSFLDRQCTFAKLMKEEIGVKQNDGIGSSKDQPIKL